MEQNIEIEVRGPLTTEQHQKLTAFLKENGTEKDIKRRIFIDYSTFLPNGGIRSRNKDIRVRVTNDYPAIVVKIGAWGGSDNRKELIFKGEKGKFDVLVEILKELGLTKGILGKRIITAYDYKGIEFALHEIPGHSYFFEAEKMATKAEDSVKVTEEINATCAQLGLVPFTQEGFFAYIEKLNAEANAVFDASELSDSNLKDIFKI